MDSSPNEYLISNDFGEWSVTNFEVIKQLVNGELNKYSSEYIEFKSKNFLYEDIDCLGDEILASKLKTKKAFIDGFSKLHIFCMTLRCNHSCIYCQVSRKTENCGTKFDMSSSVLDKSIDIMLMTPSEDITMEFQGGESLLTIDRVKEAIELTETKNRFIGKKITYVICTNLTGITKEILEYFKEKNVHISTSLDGHKELHDLNRASSNGGSYRKVMKSFELCREVLGENSFSALMTTTKASLSCPEKIIDEYIENGLRNIFIRELNPYGFATKAAKKVGYSSEEFLSFYKRALDYIIKINLDGYHFEESFAGLILKKLLTPWAIGFVDLQSPTGTGFNVTLYNYDGNVYPSDESRMLAEMGDTTFCMGNVFTHSYQELFFGETMQLIASAALNECLPMCSDCAFGPFCGAEPVRRHQTQSDVFGHRPTDSYCKRNKLVIEYIINLWRNANDDVKNVLMSWIRG